MKVLKEALFELLVQAVDLLGGELLVHDCRLHPLTLEQKEQKAAQVNEPVADPAVKLPLQVVDQALVRAPLPLFLARLELGLRVRDEDLEQH